MSEGIKREFRIDSSDSARPKATLDAEPYHYAQGLKPKTRVAVDVSYEELDELVSRGKGKEPAYEELDELVSRGKGKEPARLILRTTTFDDGATIDTTMGADAPEYVDYLQGKVNNASATGGSTRKRKPKAKVPKGTNVRRTGNAQAKE
jgi:hypothetical protein